MLLPSDSAEPPPGIATSSLPAPAELPAASAAPVPSIFEDLDDGSAGSRGRVTIYCIAEALARPKLEELLASTSKFAACRQARYPEVVHLELPAEAPSAWSQSVFFFDYGVICTWGLSQLREAEVVKLARRCAVEPLSADEVEVDQVRV